MPTRLPTRSARTTRRGTSKPTRTTSAVESPQRENVEPDVAGWEFARSMAMPYGRCPACARGQLMREAPYRVSGRVWLEATCNACGHQYVLPQGRVRAAATSHEVAPVAAPEWFRERVRDHAERAAGS